MGATLDLLTLREHGLRVYVNRVLRRMFELKRDEVTGGSRKQHNEELHNLCSSQNMIRMIKSGRMRLEGHAARIGEKRNIYINICVIGGNVRRKEVIRKTKTRWADNIKKYLGEIGWGGVDRRTSGRLL
jgi:PAS domain-containing protein